MRDKAPKLLTKQDLIKRWDISDSQFEEMKAKGELPSALVTIPVGMSGVSLWRESAVSKWEMDKE